MQKHKPVLLNEVLNELENLVQKHEYITAIDCTLGQAGHSFEIFNKIKKGVLVSIDLDAESIEWVTENINFGENFFVLEEKDEFRFYSLKIKDDNLNIDKTWFIVQSDFAEIEKIKQLFDIANFDFVLADLGFSNYQLEKNLGISYDRTGQILDMRYDSEPEEKTLTAAEVLNTFEAFELEGIFRELGQIENPKILVQDIIQKRKQFAFERVRDLLRILTKNRYPKNYKVKAFQALRAFVNKEMERLNQFLDKVPSVLSTEGEALVISFNSLEEKEIENKFGEIGQYKSLEPNITELISNNQSRSAKLYIFKKASKIKTEEEK